MSDRKSLIIDVLIIEDDRPEHIAKHDVSIDEVLDILTSSFVFIMGKYERLLVIGQTEKGRFLTVVIGRRGEPKTYGLVTARPSREKEKAFFKDFVSQQGGENDDQN